MSKVKKIVIRQFVIRFVASYFGSLGETHCPIDLVDHDLRWRRRKTRMTRSQKIIHSILERPAPFDH